jgi:hypothetical protein
LHPKPIGIVEGYFPNIGVKTSSRSTLSPQSSQPGLIFPFSNNYFTDFHADGGIDPEIDPGSTLAAPGIDPAASGIDPDRPWIDPEIDPDKGVAQ